MSLTVALVAQPTVLRPLAAPRLRGVQRPLAARHTVPRPRAVRAEPMAFPQVAARHTVRRLPAVPQVRLRRPVAARHTGPRPPAVQVEPMALPQVAARHTVHRLPAVPQVRLRRPWAVLPRTPYLPVGGTTYTTSTSGTRTSPAAGGTGGAYGVPPSGGTTPGTFRRSPPRRSRLSWEGQAAGGCRDRIPCRGSGRGHRSAWPGRGVRCRGSGPAAHDSHADVRR